MNKKNNRINSNLILILSVIGLIFLLTACDSHIDEYTLTVLEIEGQGAVVPEVGSYLYPPNQTVELKATPAEGWKFSEWIGEVIDNYNMNTTIFLDQDKTVKAVFLPVEYPVIDEITEVVDREVSQGTEEADVLELLPLTTTIIDSDGNVHSVNLVWSIAYYEADVPGDYQATASFELPDGVVQSEPEISLEISVTVTVMPDLFAGGEGTVADPYLIESAEQLNNIRYHLDKHFLQIADLDLSIYDEGEGWEPLADSGDYFTGTYDGGDFEIINLTINRPDNGIIGLFQRINETAVVKNINLKNVSVTGRLRVGALAGINYGTVDNVHVEGSIAGIRSDGGIGGHTVGGLIGENESGSLTNCTAEIMVSGHSTIGGLIGRNNTTVSNCEVSGEVTATASWTGGFIGLNYADIENCQADVVMENTGGNWIGGFIGRNIDGNVENSSASGNVLAEDTLVGGFIGTNDRGIITSCFATGNVTVNGERVGGFIGENIDGHIIDCYATGQVSSTGEHMQPTSAGGLVGYNLRG